ncbi:heparinase II/III family protein [Paenibacillus sp. J5C_2022]|uniref:chitinase N-terminal domain-containing protein n=1 Tax=Paenibacillus sp. J5C2022 TaxID=2977129 RepID=UPI0021D1AAB4|nr:chitinase N-terminal domain-containing protein [Paenibacillus sp. J5C2022]MCU6708889.1 heparinase II/III family protein [Paenibacillus sp. J5C2022]
MSHNRDLKSKFSRSKIVIFLIVFSMFVTSFHLPVATALEEQTTITDTISEPIVYPFTHLGFDGRPTLPGWGWVGERSGPPNISYQSFGANIEATSVGQRRDFHFEVPESGLYLMRTNGHGASVGGIGEFRIDGVPIGQYDYYSDPSGYLEMRQLSMMYLTEGTHTLTMEVIGKSPESTSSTGYRLRPSQFVLERQEEPIAVQELALKSNVEELFMGDQGDMQLWGQTSDGIPVMLSVDMQQVNVQFSSDDVQVIAVNASSGSFEAVGSGPATITVSGDYNGEMIAVQLLLHVYKPPVEPIVYPFTHLGFDDRPTLPGWGWIGERSGPPNISYQSFGANIEATSVGQRRDFHFEVPETGIYLMKTNGHGASVGGIGEFRIDGVPIGQYDYYSDPSGYLEMQQLSMMHLTEGTHTLTMEVIGKSPESTSSTGYRLRPSQFVLERQEEPLPFSEVMVEAKETELYPSSETDVHIWAMTDEAIGAWITDDFPGVDIQYLSSDEQIIEVDASTGHIHAVAVGAATVTAILDYYGESLSAELVLEVREIEVAKSRRTIFTEDKIQIARNNIAAHDWAQQMRDNAVAEADQYVALGLDRLWSIIPPQSLPRSSSVNREMGSPVTGREIDNYGGYPYKIDVVNDPWKITDPSSGYRFPTNDFGAYYESGLNENGIFDPSLADRSLLVNTLYPEMGETWGVDDGFGWIDDDGNRFPFIAYYIHWGIWGYTGKSFVQKSLRSLIDAYIYTGETKYARAGTVMLDRIADVYPSLDIAQHSGQYSNSHGGTGKGKALGSIWETFLVKDFIYAYDAFYPVMDDPVAIDFLQNKAQAYHLGPFKSSGAGIRKNIEDGIVKQVYPAIKAAQIRGNNGMHQSALALAAVVYDKLPETKEWLDFNFASGGLSSGKVTGGNMGVTFVNDVDRDGAGNETSVGYNTTWLNSYLETADILSGYDLYPNADLYQHVKFRKMFSAFYPLLLAEKYTANVGDSSSTGTPSIVINMNHALKAFQHYGDPIYAQLAYFRNNNSLVGINGGIYSQDPNKLAEDIQAVINAYGPLSQESVNMSGYGFAALRDGSKETVQYGRRYPFHHMPITAKTKEIGVLEGNGALEFLATEVGDAITFSFHITDPDDYEIMIKPYRTTLGKGYGQFDVKFDGQKVSELDFYGVKYELEHLHSMYLDAGEHEITFESTGKQSVSNGYTMGLYELVLLNPEEQDERDQAEQMNTLRDMWLYYGRNSGHGHRDTLNLGMIAYDLDLSPDLGYPETTGAHAYNAHEWVKNTISHNTVVVDDQMQQPQIVGVPKQFNDGEKVKLIDVEAPHVYPQTELYKRTSAMIQVDDENSYLVDFFRVKGGSDHRFSFHGAEGTVTTEGLNLQQQLSGTYAGEDVEYGVRPEDDSVAGSGYTGPGYHYLKNVERDLNPGDGFSIDWNVQDTWNVYGNGRNEPTDVHLRLTMLGGADDVALADGIPPRNRPGNPEALRYMIAHRQGQQLNSLFTSVIEPYKGQSLVESIEAAVVERDGVIVGEDEVAVKAVKVTLLNGRVDYIVTALDSSAVYTIDDKLTFKGTFGVYSEMNGQNVYRYIHEGSWLKPISETSGTVLDKLSGTVMNYTKELALDNSIEVQMELNGLNPQELIGEWIYVDHDGERNAAYEIEEVEALDSNRYRLGIGDTTLIRSYVDTSDYSKGYVYDVAEGAAFRIPLTYEVEPIVELTGLDSPLHAGSSGQIAVKVVNGGGIREDVTGYAVYSSSDNSVAEVLSGGVIMYKAAGTTVIGATYGSLQAEPLTIEVTGTAASTGAPGKPTLSGNNGHDTGLRDGDYTVTMNMWWGNNGSVYRLYENDVLIDTKVLSDGSPGEQSTETAISSRGNGVYTYRAELINGYGVTASDPLTVTVTDAAPGVPVLSHDNWDGDGNYRVTMNMWWGTNGTAYRLYENNVLIDEQPLASATPGAQTAWTEISGREVGTYEYRVELVNDAGITSSGTLSVSVER